MNTFFYTLGLKARKPKLTDEDCERIKREYRLKNLEREKKTASFKESWGFKIDRLIGEYPNILSWDGSSIDNVCLNIKTKRGAYMSRGHIVLDEKGDIRCWRSDLGDLEFERVAPTLTEEVRASQLAALLKDSDKLSKYCEQVATTLLDEGACIFNVPYGLRVKKEEYEKRYGTDEWKSAWISALAKEFQAKEVVSDEKIGCFRLEAI